MKKLIIFIFLLFDILLLIIYFNIYSDYTNDKVILLSKLDGINYEDYINKLNSEKRNIILDIENNIDYVFNEKDSFDDIKMQLDNDYNELNIENLKLDKKKKSLSIQKESLQKTYNEILEEERKMSTYLINNVPKINQYALGYPTGCESAALTNLLKFWGVSVNMSDIVKTLPKGVLPYYDNGIKYGGNPYLEFVGNPNNYSSYGVYEKPIIEVANQFKSGIIDGTGMSLDKVLEVVKENRPVMVWVSMNMAVPYISTSWIYKPTGQKISWMANEHALIVVGYNQSQVIVSDSLNGEIRYYDRRVFESRYNMYGKRAVYY